MFLFCLSLFVDLWKVVLLKWLSEKLLQTPQVDSNTATQQLNSTKTERREKEEEAKPKAKQEISEKHPDAWS